MSGPAWSLAGGAGWHHRRRRCRRCPRCPRCRRRPRCRPSPGRRRRCRAPPAPPVCVLPVWTIPVTPPLLGLVDPVAAGRSAAGERHRWNPRRPKPPRCPPDGVPGTARARLGCRCRRSRSRAAATGKLNVGGGGGTVVAFGDKRHVIVLLQLSIILLQWILVRRQCRLRLLLDLLDLGRRRRERLGDRGQLEAIAGAGRRGDLERRQPALVTRGVDQVQRAVARVDAKVGVAAGQAGGVVGEELARGRVIAPYPHRGQADAIGGYPVLADEGEGIGRGARAGEQARRRGDNYSRRSSCSCPATTRRSSGRPSIPARRTRSSSSPSAWSG